MIQGAATDLRFMRSRQSVGWWVLGGCAWLGGLLAFFAQLPLLGVLGAMGLGGLLWAVAWRVLRRPYLILTAHGIEVYGFWNPVKNGELIPWEAMGVLEWMEGDQKLVIHRAEVGSGGVVLSLGPLFAPQRALLRRALEGRAAEG